MSGQIDAPIVPPSAIVTLDHFVMVRIHARQVAQNQRLTLRFQEYQKSLSRFLAIFTTFKGSLASASLRSRLKDRGSTPLASKYFVINHLQILGDNKCDNMSIVVRYCPQDSCGFACTSLDLLVRSVQRGKKIKSPRPRSISIELWK